MKKTLCAVILVLLAILAAWLLVRHKTSTPSEAPGEREFVAAMQSAKNLLDRGEAAQALIHCRQAVQLRPAHPDARLNLAIAHLYLNQPVEAANEAREIIQLDRHNAAAHYLLGCSLLRQAKFEEAIQSFQTSLNLDPNVAAAYFHLGLARVGAGQLESAVDEFLETVKLQPDHPAAYFQLSQVYNRLGQPQEAAEALQKHQEVRSKTKASLFTLADAERCKHTQARLPARMEQPDLTGIAVTFKDDTEAVFGADYTQWKGPAAVVDFSQDGRNSLLVCASNAIRMLVNSNGLLHATGTSIPLPSNIQPLQTLAADLDNNRLLEVIFLGRTNSRVIRCETNGMLRDVTAMTGLTDVGGRSAALLDLDFTGKLDLLAAAHDGTSIHLMRNHDNLLFRDATATTGLPANVPGIHGVYIEDWDGDDVNDVFLSRTNGPPLLFSKLRGGTLTNVTSTVGWPSGAIIAAADFNNDLRTDLVVVNQSQLTLLWGGKNQQSVIPLGRATFEAVQLFDFDNDGWLDMALLGEDLRLLRNLGEAGFRDVTGKTGLARMPKQHIRALYVADFDQDGDSDWVVWTSTGLRFWRNNGGNKNHQIKVVLQGNRSNASGLGVRLEVAAGGLRLTRRAQQLPIEIGVGQHQTLDALTVNWFDLALSSVEIKVSKDPLVIPEIVFPKGSCPYVYAWDGERFRFVSDFLSSSPLGLPVAEGRYAEADPEELLEVGNEHNFRPQQGHYILQITEELSEVLYLDMAKLVAVDHPSGTLAVSTSKMMPGRPFPPAEICIIQPQATLRKATRHDGLDVTDALKSNDQQMVGPAAVRVPQLRGQAEPWSITLDFGPLDHNQPLALVLTGWIRFGGGMGNMAAARNPALPFPFPELEAQTSDGAWHKVPVVVGTPAGKTKTILVDLTGKLPPNSRQLRLSTAFEIYWDSILLGRHSEVRPVLQERLPLSAQLHYRGYSPFLELPSHLPLTPDYSRLLPAPFWHIIPAGWCTRYGEVCELLLSTDNALAIVNGGDELTLKFDASLSPPPAGWKRTFFLHSVGWDKDTDFHIASGTTVEPLPWHGLDEQQYGRQPRPSFANDGWMQKYNTRWTGPSAVKRLSANARK